MLHRSHDSPSGHLLPCVHPTHTLPHTLLDKNPHSGHTTLDTHYLTHTPPLHTTPPWTHTPLNTHPGHTPVAVSLHTLGGVFLANENSKCQVLTIFSWGGGVFLATQTESAKSWPNFHWLGGGVITLDQVKPKVPTHLKIFISGVGGGGGGGIGYSGHHSPQIFEWDIFATIKICTTCVESNEHLVIILCNTREITPQQLLSSWQAVRCLFTWTDIYGLSNKTFFVFRLLHLKTKHVICPKLCRIYIDKFRTYPSRLKFFHFHANFSNIRPNNRLASHSSPRHVLVLLIFRKILVSARFCGECAR